MGKQSAYISVILPLKLEWEPYYALPDGVGAEVGERVRVVFAGRLYLGVVSAVGVTPPPETLPRILEVREVAREKEKINSAEIEFWRRLAEYYMCSVGEVFKAAYPSVKDKDVRPRVKEEKSVPAAVAVPLEKELSSALAEVESALGTGKPVLFSGCSQESLLETLCLHHLDRNILWLVPELDMEKALLGRLESAFGSRLCVWGSDLTPAGKRKVMNRIRSGFPYVALGTRAALFLPHRNLGLVIVQDEHEFSYKQTSPAPRYNGRDAALILASVCGASCVLASCTPSMEALYNCMCGKYTMVRLKDVARPEFIVADIRAEQRKNGMEGDISRKLVALDNGRTAVYKPQRAAFPKLEELQPQLERNFAISPFVTDNFYVSPVPDGTDLLAIFGVDALLGKKDFRADERALQTVEQAVCRCPASLRKVYVQTREPEHPVFRAMVAGDATPLFQERRDFSMPPFTRLLDVHVTDSNEGRAARIRARLLPLLEAAGQTVTVPDGFRVTLSKDKNLASRKLILRKAVAEIEKEEKYAGHIYFDVDPMA